MLLDLKYCVFKQRAQVGKHRVEQCGPVCANTPGNAQGNEQEINGEYSEQNEMGIIMSSEIPVGI